MKQILYVITGVTAILVSTVNAQQYYAIVKGGVSSYGSVYFDISGASGDQNWQKGPIISAGAGIRTSDDFAAELLLEYSNHKYSPRLWEIPVMNDPHNTITELSVIGRVNLFSLSIVKFEMVAGLSLSHQHKDAIQIQYPIKEVSRTDLSVPAGIGLECQLTDKIFISLDGDWRMRYYVTPVTQLGIAYVF